MAQKCRTSYTRKQITQNQFFSYIWPMIKKGIILVIFLSMMLHCASRVGFLSYLYQHRNEIAYTIGIIAEVPIALCSSDYDFCSGLKIHVQDESDQSLPSVFKAIEIQLFFSGQNIKVEPKLAIICVNQIPDVLDKVYNSPAFSIFHPPS